MLAPFLFMCFTSAKPAQSEVHQDRHDVLLHLSGPVPPVQPNLLVERVQLEARHLGGAQHPGQIQPRPWSGARRRIL